MAHGNGYFYNEFSYQLPQGNIDLLNNIIKLMLVVGYTPDVDAHVDYSDVSGFEVVGLGYGAGGETLTGKSLTRAVYTTFKASDITWINLGVAAVSHAILIDTTLDCLLCCWEFTSFPDGGNYLINFDPTGIFDI